MYRRTLLGGLAFLCASIYNGSIGIAQARLRVISRTLWKPPEGASAVRVRAYDENGTLIMDKTIPIDDKQKFQIEALK